MRKLISLFIFIPVFTFSQSGWNLNLLGSLDYPTTQGNDIWGWVDANEHEFALVGLRNGISCVDVTNPTNPVEMFFIPDIYSVWRDIKTYGDYAYVTTESDAGLLIIDLTDMTGTTFWHVKDFINPTTGVSLHWEAAHDLYIDENGVCYIFGASNPNGFPAPPNGAIFLDVATDPINPTHLGQWNEQYIHDGMTRGDTMYVGCIYDGSVQIVDVSDKANPLTLGFAYTPNQFTHNAWVSDDGNYVFTTDEKPDAYLGAFNISDLNNIQEVDRIQSNPGGNSIPHNTFVDGNFLITSYYRDGTTIHDIKYPNYMVQVAYYDSYIGSGNGYDGCWGTYPFLPSGNIISSDINSSNGNGQLLIYGREFQQACYLKGNVIDGITSTSISNASIEILSTSINENTNLIGFYQTASVDSGTFQVVFSAPGYTSDTLTVVLTNGVMTILDAILFPPCNTFNIITNNTVQICNNTSYTIGNSTYNTPGTYSDTLVNYFGCDSVVITDITMLNSYSILSQQSICEGESYQVGSSVYSFPGNYTDILTSVNGCDSIVNTHLTIYPISVINNTYTICEDDSVIVGNSTYLLEGDYTDILQTIYGCDSVLNTSIQWSIPIVSLSLFGTNINASVSGGASPFIFEVYEASGLLVSTQNNGSTIQYNPLINGQYYFIVTDGFGCISDTAFINVNHISASVLDMKNSKELIKIIDVLGRELDPKEVIYNRTLFYIYDNGTVGKKIIIK